MIDAQIGYDDDGIRLDRWVKRHRPDIPHALLQKWLRIGTVRLDGGRAEASTRIRAGQTLTLPPSEQEGEPRPRVRAKDAARIRSWIIYEDTDVIALNKPSGVAVQGGSKVHGSIDEWLDALVEPKAARPKLVHRLDKDTSGVLLVAKSARVAAALAEAFAGRDVEKMYWALVVGVPDVRAGTIDLPLAKTAHGKSAFEKVGVDDAEGKRAVTQYRVIEKFGKTLSLVELFPRTGRTHQLRAHMLAIGHPIVGDKKYGGHELFPEGMEIVNKLYLHARRIELEVFGRKLKVEAPLTGHMKETFAALGLGE